MGLEMLKQLDQFTAGAGKENIAQAAKEARKLNWLFGTKAINTQLSQLTDRCIEIIGLQALLESHLQARSAQGRLLVNEP